MNIAVFNGSPRKHSNSQKLLTAFVNQCTSNGHTVYHVDPVSYCVHCSKCSDGSKCGLKDMTKELHTFLQNADAIVMATPIHFFSITPKTLNFLTRLYSIPLDRKIFGLIVSSGSDFDDSGISVIQSQFSHIDRFCGSITVPFFHRVTYDRVWEVSDRDLEGLSIFLKSIENTYEVIHDD